jgi:ABC-type proline/glycine betaine transport system permease subunit
MAVWEMVLLFPALARFFIGVLLVVAIVSSEALFALFIYTRYYGKEE